MYAFSNKSDYATILHWCNIERDSTNVLYIALAYNYNATPLLHCSNKSRQCSIISWCCQHVTGASRNLAILFSLGGSAPQTPHLVGLEVSLVAKETVLTHLGQFGIQNHKTTVYLCCLSTSCRKHSLHVLYFAHYELHCLLLSKVTSKAYKLCWCMSITSLCHCES